MKKKNDKLEPISHITKSEASYERLVLELLNTLVLQVKEGNRFNKNLQIRQDQKTKMTTGINFRPKRAIQSREDIEKYQSIGTPAKYEHNAIPEEQEQSQSGGNLMPKPMVASSSVSRLHKQQHQNNQGLESKFEKFFGKIEKMIESNIAVNQKTLQSLEKRDSQHKSHRFEQNKRTSNLQIQAVEKNIIEKALQDKLKVANGNNDGKKGSYVILSQILPYSDRREMKVKFKISDIVNLGDPAKSDDLKIQTAEWLGMVYRATASICWNMLLNNYLSFQEVKILFTQNIVFNFIEFMKQIKHIGKEKMFPELTSIINKKSIDILEFLCRQYPQTKIQAPNITLRQLLPQIDNQGRIKYDLVSRSGEIFTYQQDGDYTAQIMRMINFAIDRTNEEHDQFLHYMKATFEQVYLPIQKRKKFGIVSTKNISLNQLGNQDVMYRDKVKSYTKFLIGRKISKNIAKYTDEEIKDGIFFVKSSATLRIITKWVEELLEYFQKSQDKIKNSYNQNKDHYGKLIYVSALIKNGIHKEILKQKEDLFDKISKIRDECQKMEYLLTDEAFTSEPSQIHLSQQQISVGMYCSNLKSAISSYIGSELNNLIHFLLKIPKDVSADALGNDLQDFKTQARKDLDSVNLVTFKIFDLLRCKIHSNEEEIIWIVQYLLDQNEINKQKFSIVRIKDRLDLGTRDIMINAQINRGLVCQIQLSVTSNTDKKQELLDSYNHFLYELKRSELGPVTQNVSIWSNLEQRYAYFEQIVKNINQKSSYTQKETLEKHSCGIQNFISFKRPIICKYCNIFYAIPKTCLLNVICNSCSVTLCGECYYYNYLTPIERKQFIFDKNKLFKPQVMNHLIQYTDFKNKPLPATAFFIKKRFLKKELSFYMAIEKNKNDKVKDAPNIELIVVQTIVRDDQILNRQINKKEIQARLEKGQFYVKNYAKTEFNNFIIFYIQKKELKKFMTLADIKKQLQKPEHARTKIISIIREPSYLSDLKVYKKESEKVKQMNNLLQVIKQNKLTVYVFPNYFILAQACIKGSELRAEITKKVNTSSLKAFIYKQSDIVSMEFKNMTTQLSDLSVRIKPKLYNMFCQNVKKLFLSNGSIESIKCFQNFKNLQAVFISQNKLTSLEGIEKLQDLMSFRFDGNKVESLMPFANCLYMRYISGNSNNLKSLKGLQKLAQLRSLSIYQNKVESLQELQNCQDLQELYLRGNPISDVSVLQKLKKMKKLFMGKTNVTVLPDLSNLTLLKSLSLQSLNLTSIPSAFSQLKLKELWLSNNQIEKITNLQNQNELKFLTLSNNKITKIQNLSGLEAIETLKLNENKITVIQGIKDLDQLNFLYLENNPIDDIKQILAYDISFTYLYTKECITQKATKQFIDLEISKNAISSGQD